MAQVVKETPYLQLMAGMKVTALPDNSFAGAKRQASDAQAWLEQLAEIDEAQLSHDDQLTYAMFEGLLEQAVEGQQHFWHKFNVTPYAVGNGVAMLLPAVLPTATFEAEGDVATHLGFLDDFGRYLEDDLARLQGQEERGILLPKAAVARRADRHRGPGAEHHRARSGRCRPPVGSGR